MTTGCASGCSGLSSPGCSRSFAPAAFGHVRSCRFGTRPSSPNVQGLPEQVRADLAALASQRFPPAQRQGHKKVGPAPSLRRHERKEFLTVLLFYFSKRRGTDEKGIARERCARNAFHRESVVRSGSRGEKA